MAYIEAHQSLRDHRKILALAAELDMPEPHVAGHCLYLWLWSLDNAPEGALPCSERIIERAAGWTGAPGAFVAAMVTVGMLERGDDGALHIHDWFDYAGRLIEKRKANADRMRAARANTSEERATHVQRTFTARAGATVPYRTVPEREQAPVVADATSARSQAPALSIVKPEPSQDTPPKAKAGTKPPPTAARPPKADATSAPHARPSNPTWDALVAAIGCEPETKPERSNWGKAVKDLNDAGATPQEIAVRARRYVTRYGRERLTVNALVNHWGEMATEPPPAAIRASPAVNEPPTYAVVTDGRFSPWK